MEANIDLIPAEERISRTKEKTKKLSLVITIVLLLVAVGAAGGVYVYTEDLESNLNALKSEVAGRQRNIEEKADIEISSRNLDSKYKVLSEILKNRIYYSTLLEELSFKTPVNISINSLDMSSPEAASVSGTATDYISLAKFLNSLADPQISSSSASLQGKNLFKEVVINTVTLDPLDSTAKFNLNISIESSLLKKE